MAVFLVFVFVLCGAWLLGLVLVLVFGLPMVSSQLRRGCRNHRIGYYCWLVGHG